MEVSNTVLGLIFSKTTVFGLFQTDFADDNSKLDENGRKFSKSEENTVGKGEIARYEQFLFFPKCFQNSSIADTQKPGLIWERVNPLTDDKILDQTKLKAFVDDKLNVTKMIISVFDRVENIVGKFLLFPQCFHKASFPDASKGVIVWDWVKYIISITALS